MTLIGALTPGQALVDYAIAPLLARGQEFGLCAMTRGHGFCRAPGHSLEHLCFVGGSHEGLPHMFHQREKAHIASPLHTLSHGTGK